MTETTADPWILWQQLATSSVSTSILDVVRTIAGVSTPWPLLVRALAVTPVYLRVAEEGRVETSRADGEDYLHAYSTPVRLTAGLGAEVKELTIREAFVADLVDQAGGPLGIRIDPGLASEQVATPAMAREVLSVAAGLPVPAALTPAEGEELRVEAGPTELTDLDRRVRDALRAVDPEARVVRAAVTLVGIGGRVWPVYSITATSASPDDIAGAVQDAARPVPTIVLVDGRPDGLATALAIGDVCLELSNLREARAPDA